MMNINSYYPPGAGSFSHQPLSLHHEDTSAAHQLSNGFHHSVTAAPGFMSPTHYSSRSLCPRYDLAGGSSQSKARFVSNGDDQLMGSAASDVNAPSTPREHPTAGYASLGADPSPHHPHVHHHLHHHQHQQQQQVTRWGMTVADGGGSGQTSTTPPPLMQTSAFNSAIQAGAHHLNRPTAADTSPPAAVPCQSPHSAGAGFNSTGHIPFYPWMGVVGKPAFCLFFSCIIFIVRR